MPFIGSLTPYPFIPRLIPRLMGGGTGAPADVGMAEGTLEVGVDKAAVNGGVRTD